MLIFNDVIEGSRLKITLSVFGHESLSNELLFIKESFVSCILLEALRNAFISITYQNDSEILLCKLLFVTLLSFPKGPIVLQDAFKRVFQLNLIFIEHRYTCYHCWIPLAQITLALDFLKQAFAFNWLVDSIFPETHCLSFQASL